ncbi:Sb-PDE family phosphodiesterase [Aestuariibaculum sediminum]|uniref:Polymerase/histidinol phosphatase N-terminal domain-containing protein n=1 Tax=Aestuariibaculum sediminum TaxID=2770637 RepID=A0A8J6Q0Z9_9FLAO|nr:Sb-PDE family phosphodiesterase [Aestuariibaculum sediminum]MBD0833663.1 hypothetical protein [Aestuariibaculum sediminum]
MKKKIFKNSLKFVLLLCITVSAQIRNEINIPDIPGYKTLKGDFHIHTVYSDGRVWPDIRVQEAWHDGLDVIALTDHINYKGPVLQKAVKFEDENLPHRDAEVIAERLGITLIKGLEINRYKDPVGHFNILFLEDINLLKPVQGDLLEAFREAKKQGAFIQLNHPLEGQGKNPHWQEFHKQAYDEKLLDGLEIFNNKKLHEEAIPWAIENKLTITSTSDIHYLVNLSHFEVHRPVTLIFAKENTEKGIKEAMFERRTAVYFADTIIGEEKFLKPLFSQSVELLDPANVVYRKKRYAQLKNHTDIRFVLEKVREDKVVDLPKKNTLLPNTTNLLEFKVKDSKGIDKREFKVTYRVMNFKKLTGEPIEVEMVFNKEKQEVKLRKALTPKTMAGGSEEEE